MVFGDRTVGVIVILCCVLVTGNEVVEPVEYCPPTIDDPPKTCNLREAQYDERVWNYFAGFFCYNFTDTARLVFKYNFTSYTFKCRQYPLTLPIVKTTGKFIFFNYKETSSMEYIRKSFKSDSLFENFRRCCREAEECCATSMNASNIQSDPDYCPAVWDAWTCFPRTPVNTVARQPCSSQAYQSPDAICTLDSEKLCYFNNTLGLAKWIQKTNYAPCAIAPVYAKRHKFHVNFFYACIAVSLPAIFIFFSFEKFRKTTRVVLHRNLLIAIVVRNILTILSKELVVLDALKPESVSKHVMLNNPIYCRILSFFESSSKNCIYACMLVDGFYLHKVIVRTFAKEPDIIWMYAVISVLTFLPTMIWATILTVNGRENCWMVDTNNEQWAVDSFRAVILGINTLLLFDIIRVMLSKMNQGSTSRQTKAAFRATLFLIPLFGIHIIVTAKKFVYDDTCAAEDVYEYIRYSMEALQGIFVAVLFCYANAEVHKEIENAWRKVIIRLNSRYGWKVGKHNGVRRRTTAATYVGTKI